MRALEARLVPTSTSRSGGAATPYLLIHGQVRVDPTSMSLSGHAIRRGLGTSEMLCTLLRPATAYASSGCGATPVAPLSKL